MTEINELIIRLPGMGQDEARQLGQDLGQYLAQHLPAPPAALNIEQLNIQLPLRPGQSRSQLVVAIAEQIIHQLDLR